MESVAKKEYQNTETYETMTDDELLELMDAVIESNKKRYSIESIEELTDEEIAEFIKVIEYIPMTEHVIDLIAGYDKKKREALYEENKRLYAERKWEQFL